MKGTLEVERLSLWRSSVRRTWSGDSFTGDPGGYVEKALQTGISLRGSSMRGTWREGSFTGDSEGYAK